MDAHPTELLQQRLKAGFRESPALLKAWSMAVASAMQVRAELEVRGWEDSELIAAANQLCLAVLSTAPDATTTTLLED